MTDPEPIGEMPKDAKDHQRIVSAGNEERQAETPLADTQPNAKRFPM